MTVSAKTTEKLLWAGGEWEAGEWGTPGDKGIFILTAIYNYTSFLFLFF